MKNILFVVGIIALGFTFSTAFGEEAPKAPAPTEKAEAPKTPAVAEKTEAPKEVTAAVVKTEPGKTEVVRKPANTMGRARCLRYCAKCLGEGNFSDDECKDFTETNGCDPKAPCPKEN